MTVTTEKQVNDTDDTEQPSDEEAVAVDGDDAEDTPDAEGLRHRLSAFVSKLRPRQGFRRYARPVLVAVVFVAAFATTGVLGWKLWDQRQVDEAGQAAQRAAVAYAQVLTSIDSNQIDQNFTAVLDGATGEFRDTYNKSSAQLRQLLIENEATAHGTVIESAIESKTQNKVVVLLMVDQTVTNTARPDSRVDRSRMKMTMERVGNRWLASKVELP